MKIKTLMASAAIVAAVSGAQAQDYTDALRFNRNDVIGTARSQAMAGAYGAIGADLSSMAINPAGMAVYRATEIGLSLGVNVIKDESEYFQCKADDDKVKVPFNQMGAAFSFGRMREEGGGLVASNIFIGYNRLADFSSRQLYTDHYALNSLLDYFCMEEQKDAAMTGGLAYEAYLTNDDEATGLTYNIWEQFVGDGVNPNFRVDEDGLGLVDIRKAVKESGSKGDIAIGYAANISNKLYIGGSVNIQTVTYDRDISHHEEFFGYTAVEGDATYFSYYNYLEQDATGVCFNLGAIYKPVNFLRVGFALHSPTFFSVNERFGAKAFNPGAPSGNMSKYYDGEYEYNYRTPSRFIASVAGIFGKAGLISVDYERANQTRSKFREKDDDDFYDPGTGSTDPFVYVNEVMKDRALQATNTIRIGGELSLLNPVYLRAGYRTTTSPLKSDYYVHKPKDYAVSGGVGLRLNNFFLDLAYVCGVQKGDHWVLPDSAEPYVYEENAPALLTHKTHSGVITVGFRF